jgi:hypothetical protein
LQSLFFLLFLPKHNAQAGEIQLAAKTVQFTKNQVTLLTVATQILAILGAKRNQVTLPTALTAKVKHGRKHTQAIAFMALTQAAKATIAQKLALKLFATKFQ